MTDHEHEWGEWEEGVLGEPYGNPLWWTRCKIEGCSAGRVRLRKP